MRAKQFIASDMSEIMFQIKSFLGPDAVIISNEKKDNKFYVTAAIEEDAEQNYSNLPIQLNRSSNIYNDSNVKECLEYHEVGSILSSKILSLMRYYSKDYDMIDEKEMLTKVLSEIFDFVDVLDNNKCKLFMGPPGAGKSTAIAKMATYAKFEKKKPVIISTDNIRAGANKQLEAFASILEVPFYFAEGERKLYELYKKVQEKYDVILVDTPGVNPFKNNEIEKLYGLYDTMKCDAFVVIDAGRNLNDSIEITGIFKTMGANFILPTRLDLTRRIGSILASAYENNMKFSAASVCSSIANGLSRLDAQTLASLILS